MSVEVFAGYQGPEDYESEDLRPDSPLLTPIPYTRPEPEPEPAALLDRSPSPLLRHFFSTDLARAIVLRHLAPNNPELAQIDPNPLESSSSASGASSRRCSDMSNHYHGGEAVEVTCVKPELPSLADIYPAAHIPRRSSSGRQGDNTVDVRTLEAKAAAAVRESEAHSMDLASLNDEGVVRQRVDSAQEQVEQKPPERRRSSPLGQGTALRLKTTLPAPQGLVDTLSDPLSRHVISSRRPSVGSLPSLHHSPPLRDVQLDTMSPASNRLPSIRQLTSTVPLEQLAEVATHQEPVPPSLGRHHSHSIGSAGSPTSYFPYPIGLHGSPTHPAHYARNPRSPSNSISEPHPMYGSPSFPCPSAAYYYNHRRSSSIAERTPSGPPSVPSLPSASSTGSIHTQASSSADGGYSTHHTTPINSSTPLPDGLPQRTLPPPPGMMLPSFRCDWPGCTAPPFSTQYLLSSHRNVHSQNRPYYCSVRGCARSEGGRGFKRKNEMIRHGLVHESPGYRCPFCPEREHRYPRPDNLLRHVNVHHTDRERNDPRLTAVLAQRREGAGKARRRRTTGGNGADAVSTTSVNGADDRQGAGEAGDDYGDDGDDGGQADFYHSRNGSRDLSGGGGGGGGEGNDYVAADEGHYADTEAGNGGSRKGSRIWGNIVEGGGGERVKGIARGGEVRAALVGDGPPPLSLPLGLS